MKIKMVKVDPATHRKVAVFSAQTEPKISIGKIYDMGAELFLKRQREGKGVDLSEQK
jgi:hypothetical protein